MDKRTHRIERGPNNYRRIWLNGELSMSRFLREGDTCYEFSFKSARREYHIEFSMRQHEIEADKASRDFFMHNRGKILKDSGMPSGLQTGAFYLFKSLESKTYAGRLSRAA